MPALQINKKSTVPACFIYVVGWRFAESLSGDRVSGPMNLKSDFLVHRYDTIQVSDTVSNVNSRMVNLNASQRSYIKRAGAPN